MPVYQVTFKSGAQQFFELDVEEADQMGDLYRRSHSDPDPSTFYSLFESTGGAFIDVSLIAGFQHYLPQSYAERRFAEDEVD